MKPASVGGAAAASAFAPSDPGHGTGDRDAPAQGPPDIYITVHHEAIPDQGEDALPLLYRASSGLTALGVFDGMGGAGGARYMVDGTERKGAYIASRLARGVVADEVTRRFTSSPPLREPAACWESSRQFVEGLDRSMRTALSVTADGLGGEPSRLRSNLVRVLPTTAALALVWPYLYRDAHTSQPVHAASAIWAGDSRIYLLQPATGLSQVTVDDTRVEMDALQSLQSDPPLDNCLSASADFTLHSAVWEFEGLGIVIAATDGCFGYMPTPAHFEAVLLDSLAGAAGPTEWQAVLTERIGAVAADDATLAAAVVGSKSFEQLKTAFAPRLATLVERFVSPYNRRDEAVRASERELEVATARRTELVEARATCAQQLWDQYRPGYEKMLPAPVEEGPAE